MADRVERGRWHLRTYRGQWAAIRYGDDGRRERHSLGADRGAAERAVERLNRADRPVRTVAEIWDAWCRAHDGQAVIATMHHTWKALAPTFGALEPDMIGLDHCRGHTARRRGAGISDGTIHTELGHLRMVLNWAATRARLIPQAPWIERPPKPAPRDHYLTRDQVRALIDAAQLPHVRLYLVLLITTSARIGALLDLTWDRVDLAAARIHLTNPDDPVRRKGRATIPINRTAMAALQEARRGALTGHVIEWAGQPVASIKRSMRTTARRAGLTATPHVLRHSAAVWMAEAGVDDRKIAEFLGHSNVAMVQRVYARFRPDHLVDAAEVLELEPVRDAAQRVAK